MSGNSPTAFGSWKSPITAVTVAAGSLGLDQVRVDGQDTYWIEARPTEGGRNVIVRYRPSCGLKDSVPPPWNIRTRVHEYGGGAYLIDREILYFSHFPDQRLYRQLPGATPEALTPPEALRYADLIMDPYRYRILCVREDHRPDVGDPMNTLAAIPLDPGRPQILLAEGQDFYAAPRLSPDGRLLAWISWNHPCMPWEGSELHVAEFDATGRLGPAKMIAGGAEESVCQPVWASDGRLYFISDRSNWWNLYRWNGRETEALCPTDADFCRPMWVLGMSSYAFVGSDHILCNLIRQGFSRLHLFDLRKGELLPLELPYTEIDNLQAAGSRVVFLAGSPVSPSAVVEWSLDTSEASELRSSSSASVDPRYLSSPRPIEFPTTGGRTAFGFYYGPQNPDFTGTAGERPPLLVRCHGGPTSAASTQRQLGFQFWTSRGFAVLDVNYRGSSGYGRRYREELREAWGISDVEDCLNGARFLVSQGLADAHRLAISGGSAGGYTVLCALAFHNLFHAGTSYYGVSNLETLLQDTHKFESRYLESLVGAYPEFRERYRARSPLHSAGNISCPVLLLQGMEDRIVPPAQAESMFGVLRQRGQAVSYLAFEGEQHGFRQASSIQRALEAELYFYSRVFGFEPADPLPPIPIENFPSGGRGGGFSTP